MPDEKQKTPAPDAGSDSGVKQDGAPKPKVEVKVIPVPEAEPAVTVTVAPNRSVEHTVRDGDELVTRLYRSGQTLEMTRAEAERNREHGFVLDHDGRVRVYGTGPVMRDDEAAG